MPSKKNKYNNWTVGDKNIVKFDTEIVAEYKGQKLPDDLLMVRCYTKKNECHVAFVPDYENKRVGTTMDKDDTFATSVLQWMIDSGTAERLMKEIYDLLWGNPQQGQLSLPTLNLPNEGVQYNLIPKS